MEGQGQNAKAVVYFQDIGQKKTRSPFCEA